MWKFRLGKIGFQHAQWLICTGHLKVQGDYMVVSCERRKCYACEFGKGRCISNRVNKRKKNPIKEQEINQDHLLPRHMVSNDH